MGETTIPNMKVVSEVGVKSEDTRMVLFCFNVPIAKLRRGHLS